MDLMDFRNPQHWRWFGAFGAALWIGLLLFVLVLNLPPLVKVVLTLPLAILAGGCLLIIPRTYTLEGKQRILKVAEMIERSRDRTRLF
jgi:hypothetical protein